MWQRFCERFIMHEQCEYCTYRFTRDGLQTYLCDLHQHMQDYHIHESAPRARARAVWWVSFVVVSALLVFLLHAWSL
jgi:hypothetical protein